MMTMDTCMCMLPASGLATVPSICLQKSEVTCSAQVYVREHVCVCVCAHTQRLHNEMYADTGRLSHLWTSKTPDFQNPNTFVQDNFL